MKALERLRENLANHAYSYRMGGVGVAALLLVVIFVLTQPVNLRRHNALLNHFSNLQSDESRLGEAVLQLNFNLLNNYDPVTRIMDRLQATASALHQGDAAGELLDVADFQQQLGLLAQRLQRKQEVLERFKSRNAVLKNSLLYLPHARDELLLELSRTTLAYDHLNALTEQLLLNRINGGLLERGNVKGLASDLQAEAKGLAPAVQLKVESLVRHALQIDEFERSMPDLVRQLTSPADNSGLAQSYARHFELQQQRAAFYRVFLLLATLTLLAYTVHTINRMREQTRSLELAASVFATASEGITITDTMGTILDVNAAFSRLTGYNRDEVIGKNPRVLASGYQDRAFYEHMWRAIADIGTWQGEIWNRKKDGEVYPEWLTITAATTQMGTQKRLTHYVATFSDLSQRKKDEAEIYQLAFYDSLTALPNRRLLMDRLRQVLSSRSHQAGQAALLFIDIDHFKNLNDVKGHDIGDLLLTEVAARLQSCAREGDTIARLGSDEFVVLLQGLKAETEKTPAQAKFVAEKIRAMLAKPFWLKGFEYHCTSSVGISMSSSVSAEDMLQHANTAMSEAKAAGRDTLRFFDPLMQSALEARAMLQADLRQAVVQQQFVLYYQLQVNAENQALGAEALVRWLHPQNGLVSPADFIPLAEDTGLILPLGQWILETACAQLQVWQANPATRELVLSVNISARQLSADEFVGQVQSALLNSGIKPDRLKLEITESMLLSGIEKVILTMQQLKALGVSFSLDDFGTGYSSLQYLRQLPLDQVKIDQSFVRNLATVRRDLAIVATIVAMAHNLGLSVIAEGVETLEQRELLAGEGCNNYQGYLFSRPVPIEDFEAMLTQYPSMAQPGQALSPATT